jgi:pimeloyl-ACP methyl ester carboxylesterase
VRYPAAVLLRFYLLASTLYLMLAGARRRVLDDGPVSAIYYRIDRGGPDGEPWLLLHGLGSVAASWGRVLPGLGNHCRVIVPELSALGGTRSPKAGLDVAQGARLAAQLIERELDGGPVSVAGLSMGGWMAMRLAQERPDLVARLVLIDAAGYRWQDWDRIGGLVRVQDLGGVRRLYRALYHRAPWIMRRSQPAFLRAYTSPSVRNLLSMLNERDTYRRRHLAQLGMPVAMIWGEHDGLFTLKTARAMARAAHHAPLYVLPGCGHAVHQECPRQLAATLRQVRRDLPLA